MANFFGLSSAVFGFGLRVRSTHFAASLCFARSYLGVVLVISFGGGFHRSGHLRHGCRSTAAHG
ncbi:hypothetical protein QWZ13_06360 [Reinekea marina]|uniref:hypothetical protein n=1 Tax=Reinekea marina TaxID=1310421 RepID=UPI0025B625F8|nr:hypothetical protein [Reinekea marina]MDN3648531.1 hypothetical protein [Reinekea marina]